MSKYLSYIVAFLNPKTKIFIPYSLILNPKSLILHIFVFVFIFFQQLSPVSAQKQSKNDLESKKNSLQKEIEYTNKLLNETKNNKKISLNQLVTLNKKINVREELISVIYNEINLLNRQILTTYTSIEYLRADLEKLKQEYAKMIYYAYKNSDAYNKMMFIFASKDFTQAYMRLKYLQQYSDYRHKQALMIEKTQTLLNLKMKLMEERKEEKRLLLSSQESEKQNLSKEKTEKEEVFSQLQEKEKQLKADLEKKKKDAEKLQLAIRRIIEEEIKKAREKARIEKKPEPIGLELTPEAKMLSGSFEKNKGKLPWPVAQGIIIGKFGIHAHPLMPSISISNNGIDLSTSKGASARAVFDGEVTAVANIPSSGKLVVIRHGEYLSVYANLDKVYVKAGDKIKTKQELGSVIYDESDVKTELHLEIWKGQAKLDPESWLYKNN